MSVCTKRCSSCYFGTTYARMSDGQRICDYILITGHRRGCPAGDDCDKYRKGRRRPMKEAIDWDVMNRRR